MAQQPRPPRPKRCHKLTRKSINFLHIILLLIYTVDSLSFTPIWWRKMQLERQLQKEHLESKLIISPRKSPKTDETISFFDNGDIQARTFTFDTIPVLAKKKLSSRKINQKSIAEKHEFLDRDFDVPILKKIDYGKFDPKSIKSKKPLPPLYPLPPPDILSERPLEISSYSNNSLISIESVKKSSISIDNTVIPARVRFLNQISKLQENRVALARERSHMLEIERARRAFVGKIDKFFAPSRQVRRLKENLKERINAYFGGLKDVKHKNITMEIDVAEFDQEKTQFRNCKNEDLCPWIDLGGIGFLGGYGCHCAFQGDAGGGNIHGHRGPVKDELDSLCKQMTSCLRCVEIDIRQGGEGDWCELDSSRSPVDALGNSF